MSRRQVSSDDEWQVCAAVLHSGPAVLHLTCFGAEHVVLRVRGRELKHIKAVNQPFWSRLAGRMGSCTKKLRGNRAQNADVVCIFWCLVCT